MPRRPVEETGLTHNDVISRLERYPIVGSTNDVVDAWLAAGEDEVCVALADEQSAGRGREGRRWTAPAGAALLVSLGFRPTWLAPDRVWRIAATLSLAMAEAGEAVAGLPPGTVRLKWPNDLVAESAQSSVEWLAGASPSTSESRLPGPQGVIHKLAGVLGESTGLGSDDPRVVVGIGMNADWPPEQFPSELASTMTSLRALAGAPIDREALLNGFVAAIVPRIRDLRAGRFDEDALVDRQVTTGRTITLETGDGIETVTATGVDRESGALVVVAPGAPDASRLVHAGEVRHVRLTPAGAAARPRAAVQV